MKRRAKGKKKIAFSKIIFAGVSIMTISVVIFSCRMIYITGDLSPLAYLIPSVFRFLPSWPRPPAFITRRQKRRTPRAV